MPFQHALPFQPNEPGLFIFRSPGIWVVVISRGRIGRHLHRSKQTNGSPLPVAETPMDGDGMNLLNVKLVACLMINDYLAILRS